MAGRKYRVNPWVDGVERAAALGNGSLLIKITPSVSGDDATETLEFYPPELLSRRQTLKWEDGTDMRPFGGNAMRGLQDALGRHHDRVVSLAKKRQAARICELEKEVTQLKRQVLKAQQTGGAIQELLQS